MPHAVLVTRPEPGASETASRLKTLGYAPVVLPLTRLQSLGAQPPRLSSFDLVVATSANCLRFAPLRLLRSLAGKPCVTVGERTGRAAREAGLHLLATAAEAVELAELAISRAPVGGQILYLAGRVRRGDLEDRLRMAGLTVDVVETYDTLPIDYTIDWIAAATGWRPLDAALVYSAAGADALGALAERPQLRQLFDRTRFVAISPRAAASLKMGRITVAGEPTEAGILVALGRVLPQASA